MEREGLQGCERDFHKKATEATYGEPEAGQTLRHPKQSSST